MSTDVPPNDAPYSDSSDLSLESQPRMASLVVGTIATAGKPKKVSCFLYGKDYTTELIGTPLVIPLTSAEKEVDRRFSLWYGSNFPMGSLIRHAGDPPRHVSNIAN